MTDTQADLTERARAVFLAWIRSRPTGAYQSSIMATEATRLIDLYTAFAQSEREAAAAEARRAALREAEIVCGPETWAGFRIRALASPTPQEETR